MADEKLFTRENAKTLREALDERYVLEGEYSPNTRVGMSDLADNLKSDIGTLDNTAFLRQTSGGSADVQTGEKGALLKRLYGNTLLFNQLARELTSGNYSTDNAYTFSDNTATVRLDSSGYDAERVGRLFSLASETFKLKANHIYYSRVTLTFSGEVTSCFQMQLRYGASSDNEIVFKIINENDVPLFTSVANTPITIEDIRTAPSEVDNTYTRLRLALIGKGGTDIDYTDGTDLTYSNINIFDLTEMFGAGNEPATVDEFKALFPLDYYAYNAGEIVYSSATSVSSYSANLYTEGLPFPVIGGLDYAIDGVSAANIVEKDAAGNVIKTTAYSALGTVYSLDNSAHSGYANSSIKGITLDNKTYSVELTDVTANAENAPVYFGLAWSKPYTGDKTHKVETYSLGSEVYRSVGSSCDEKTPNGIITRKIGVLTGVTGGIGDTVTLAGGKDGTAIISSGGRDIGSVSGTTLTLSVALTDATVLYELATPVIEQGAPYTEAQYVNDYGIQIFSGTTVPQGAEYFYQINLKDFLQRAYSEVGGNPNSIVNATELNSAVYGVRGISGSVTLQVSDWTIASQFKEAYKYITNLTPSDLIQFTPATKTDAEKATAAGLYIDPATDNDKVTFTVTTTPSSTITLLYFITRGR